MNKTIKLSLAAAMMAGMVSNLNASVKLEEALKDVKVKGYVSYTMEEYTDKDGKDDEAQHDIDVRVQVDVPVNDKYSYTVRIDEVNDDDTDANPNDADSTAKDSSGLELEADQVYFTYKDAGLKVKAGLQKVVAPRLHDSINGDGVNVSYKMNDAMKVVGGYFYSTEKTGTDEVLGLGVAGKAGNISYGVTYANIMDSKDNNNDGSTGDNGATIIDATVAAKLGNGLTVNAAHTTRSDDASGSKDQSLTVVGVSGNAGTISYGAAYAMVGEDGANVAVDGDADASVNLVLDSVSTDALKDGNAIYAKVGTKLSKTLSASLEYVTASTDAKGATDVKDANEMMIKLTNKVTKKFKTFVSYNDWKIEEKGGTVAEDRTRVILGAKYSF